MIMYWLALTALLVATVGLGFLLALAWAKRTGRID